MKKILIIDCGSNKTDNIISIVEASGYATEKWHLFYPTIDFKLNLKEYPNKVCLIRITNNQVKIKEFNESLLATFQAVIFSGGGLLEGIQNEIKSFFKYLLKVEIPVLGICFGHQIIGLVYEAEIYKLDNKITGNFKTHFINPSKLITDEYLQSDKSFAKNHTEAITLPTNFELIANSDTCKNEMMRHKNKYVFGVQFHPEVSGIDGENIIKKFLEID